MNRSDILDLMDMRDSPRVSIVAEDVVGLCTLALDGLDLQQKVLELQSRIEIQEDTLDLLHQMTEDYRNALAEVSQQAARLKQEMEVTTDNQILWQERCFDTERECEKWKAVAKSREQPTLAADLGLALARASTAERALRNIAARVDRDGGQKQEFESVEDTAKRIDLVLANMIMHVDLLRAANGQNHR